MTFNSLDCMLCSIGAFYSIVFSRFTYKIVEMCEIKCENERELSNFKRQSKYIING